MGNKLTTVGASLAFEMIRYILFCVVDCAERAVAGVQCEGRVGSTLCVSRS